MQRTLAYLLGFFAFGAFSVALSVSSPAARSAPKFPAPATGHTVAFALRGTGTVYLTSQEWQAIAPYWHTAYWSGALFVAFSIGCVLYNAFMKGWRETP
jgi:hypothetical protein